MADGGQSSKRLKLAGGAAGGGTAADAGLDGSSDSDSSSSDESVQGDPALAPAKPASKPAAAKPEPAAAKPPPAAAKQPAPVPVPAAAKSVLKSPAEPAPDAALGRADAARAAATTAALAARVTELEQRLSGAGGAALASSAQPPHDSLVRVNVGGTVFTTRRATLLSVRKSALAKLCQASAPARPRAGAHATGSGERVFVCVRARACVCVCVCVCAYVLPCGARGGSREEGERGRRGRGLPFAGACLYAIAYIRPQHTRTRSFFPGSHHAARMPAPTCAWLCWHAHGWEQEQTGPEIFNDRSPKCFEDILNWLRDQSAPSALPFDNPLFVHEVKAYGPRCTRSTCARSVGPLLRV